MFKVGHAHCGTGKARVESAAQFADMASVIAISNAYCTVEPYVDSKFDLHVQKIGRNYKALMRKSLSGNWKTNMGQSILEEITVADRYKVWIDGLSEMFGGLDICSLEAVVARDGREFIIEVNDCATALMGESQEDDRKHIADLVIKSMEEKCLPSGTVTTAAPAAAPAAAAPTANSVTASPSAGAVTKSTSRSSVTSGGRASAEPPKQQPQPPPQQKQTQPPPTQQQQQQPSQPQSQRPAAERKPAPPPVPERGTPKGDGAVAAAVASKSSKAAAARKRNDSQGERPFSPPLSFSLSLSVSVNSIQSLFTTITSSRHFNNIQASGDFFVQHHYHTSHDTTIRLLHTTILDFCSI